MNQANSLKRCGIVSIVGRPNTGKSTLLNCILDEKIAIVSKVPQTTRHQIRGIYHDDRGQIIFIDTPGIHQGKDKLDKLMNQSSFHAMEEVDCVIHLVDTSRRVGPEERMAIDHLKGIKAPVILGLNKMDLKGKFADEYITLWQDIKGDMLHDARSFLIFPLSGKTGRNVDQLVNAIFEFLPQGPMLYPDDMISDVPKRIAMADIIREKLFELMQEEIPHALSVIVESVVPKPKKVLYILANILIERDSQKQIIIGKKGQMLKKVGTLARLELEKLLDKNIYLDLQVKVEKDWRDNVGFLKEMGYEI